MVLYDTTISLIKLTEGPPYSSDIFPSDLQCLVQSLWPSGQSSWLQIQRSGFDSRRYQVFWEVVGLERDQLGLVNTTEELLVRKSSGSGLEIREYGRRDLSRWPRGILYPHKLALISAISGGLSVGIVRSRTEATEFGFLVLPYNVWEEVKQSLFKTQTDAFSPGTAAMSMRMYSL
jgi:hypothetical protein